MFCTGRPLKSFIFASRSMDEWCVCECRDKKWPVTSLFQREGFLPDSHEKCSTSAELSLVYIYIYICVVYIFILLFALKHCFVLFFSSLNQYIHEEPQTLMAIIMFISSTLRCGFNISFRGTSLNSCKLFPSGTLKKANIKKHFTSHSFHSICVWARDRDGEMHYIITKLRWTPKTFHAPFSLYTNTAMSYLPHLGWPRIWACEDNKCVEARPRLTRLFTLLKRGHHFPLWRILLKANAHVIFGIVVLSLSAVMRIGCPRCHPKHDPTQVIKEWRAG